MANQEIIFYYFLSYMPIALAFFLFFVLKKKFFDTNAKAFDLLDEKIMLEIKMPKEIEKTPLAMELVFSALHSTGGESHWYALKILGKRRVCSSLEIVSKGGNIKFFVWTSKKFRKVVESAFYSQYPSVQIVETLDYTKFYSFDPEKQSLFGVEYKLSKEDPYPIKSYKDFGLDKVGLKPEEAVDPISHILEVMGNIDKGENMWLQFVIRGQKKDSGSKRLGFFDILKEQKIHDPYDWEDEAKKIIEGLRNVENNEEEGLKRLNSDSEKELIDAVTRNIAKPSFWVGIRSVYFNDEDGTFNVANIPPQTSIFNTLNSKNLNSLSAGGFTTDFDYSWNDFKDGRRMKKIKKDFFADYKRRKYFTDSKKINENKILPFSKKMIKYNDFIMSTEELATIFHLPSTVVATPTFEREDSKKSVAPSNLPF